MWARRRVQSTVRWRGRRRRGWPCWRRYLCLLCLTCTTDWSLLTLCPPASESCFSTFASSSPSCWDCLLVTAACQHTHIHLNKIPILKCLFSTIFYIKLLSILFYHFKYSMSQFVNILKSCIKLLIFVNRNIKFTFHQPPLWTAITHLRLTTTNILKQRFQPNLKLCK